MMLSQSNKSPSSILPFFPAGLPDETIGSRVSRYHIRRGQPTTYATYQQLFSRGPFSLTNLVQPYLENLAARLPGSAARNLAKLQDESTLLPLFHRFSGTQISTKRMRDEFDEATIEMPRRIIGDSRLTHVCTDCLVEDEQTHGCQYIHRAHQIPGVTACWKHSTILVDRCPSCRQPFAQPNQLILSAWLGCDCGHSLSYRIGAGFPAPAVEVGFARFAHALLVGEPLRLTPDQMGRVYRARINELGFGLGNSRVRRGKLLSEIESFFGRALLSRIDPAYRHGKMSGWFKVLESVSSEAPLHRHLLLAFFLFRDPAIFLKCTREFHEAEKHHSLGEGCQNPLHATEQDVVKKMQDELLEEMIKTAQRFNYDSQQLWRFHPGSMKRLVKLLPYACELIDARLKEAATKKTKILTRTSRQMTRDQESDALWEKAIEDSAAHIYGQEQRPFRITMNRLVKGSKYRPKGTGSPNELRYPLTRAKSQACAESIWHFYARRMLWTLQSLHDPDTPVHKIIFLSKLELYKGTAILEYFSDFKRCGGTSIKEINALLASRGIATDWIGPCPERTFYKAGRAYKLRTSRRGKIGERSRDVRSNVHRL